MPSELYRSLGAAPAQNPRDAAMTLLRQRGVEVPGQIANNPQAIIQHLMQTGQVPGNRLQMAQQALRTMFRR